MYIPAGNSISADSLYVKKTFSHLMLFSTLFPFAIFSLTINQFNYMRVPAFRHELTRTVKKPLAKHILAVNVLNVEG